MEPISTPLSLSLGIILGSLHPFHPKEDYHRGLSNNTPGIYLSASSHNSAHSIRFGFVQNSWGAQSNFAEYGYLSSRRHKIAIGCVSGYSGSAPCIIYPAYTYRIFSSDSFVLTGTITPSKARKVPVFSAAIEYRL